MYRIKINNMKFHSHIGVYTAEKQLGQNLEIDLSVELKEVPLDDDLNNTLSYGQFYLTVEKVVQASRVDLIETLVQTIIAQIKALDQSKITKVKVKLRKLAVPIDGIFDSVEVEMEG